MLANSLGFQRAFRHIPQFMLTACVVLAISGQTNAQIANEKAFWHAEGKNGAVVAGGRAASDAGIEIMKT
ncbi:MAG: hypothetical protein ACKO85_15295, partial [Isosphaeraceae bacterium]